MNSKLRQLAMGVALALGSGGCATVRSAKESGPPPPHPLTVPPACKVVLSGNYRHAKDAQYRYRASDDGNRLVLSALTPLAGAEAPEVTLVRGSDGFKGETRAMVLNGQKRPCPLAYPTEVVSCDAEGLTLRTVQTRGVDERCQSQEDPEPHWAEHRLVRE